MPALVEAIGLLVLLGVALAARLWWLRELPPGLHYDEAIDLDAGLRILAGERPLFIAQGWGREPLYYYLMALVLAAVPDHVLALRLTSVISGLAGLLVCYGFVRRLAGPVAAWVSGAWWAVLFWSVYLSRAGNRGILLPVFLVAAAWLFWSAWERRRLDRRGALWRFAVAGGLLGLDLYTYQPARFAPFVFLAIAIVIFLADRPLWRLQRRGLVVFLGSLLLVASPLAWILSTTPGLEGDRTWTIEPLLRLLDGDPRPVLDNLWATARMFSVAGDPLVSYNVPGRPVFSPAWTSVFFYAGLALALWRWRWPAHLLLLAWLAIMLAPTVLTISAPNWPRTVGALFPTVALAGLGADAAVRWARRHAGIAGDLVVGVGVLLALGAGALATGRDYFTAWPAARPDAWETVYNVYVQDVVRDLSAPGASQAAVISSRNIEDAHPVIVATTLQRPAIQVRWVDSTRAVAWPADAGEATLYVTRDRWLDADLSTFLGLDAAPARYLDTFAALTLGPPRNDSLWLPGLPAWVVPAGSPDPLSVVADPPDALPATFAAPIGAPARVRLDGVVPDREAVPAGQSVLFYSAWTVLAGDRGRPLSLFAHLVDESGGLLGQEDGLGYPLHTWQAGDRFVQAHHVPVPGEAAAGLAWLRLGLYEVPGGERWQVTLETATGDSLLLPPIAISQP